VIKRSREPKEFPLERFRLFGRAKDPRRAILQRIALAMVLVLAVTLITWFDRTGYLDANDPSRELTFIDCLYYATVTITTTGYGDIVPNSELARLISTVIVTPMRVLFLVLLVGTTLEALTTQSRLRSRVNAKQKELNGHTIICGFGVKGLSALEYLRKHDASTVAIAIDSSEDALRRANTSNVDGILGSAYERDILVAAGVERATKMIIALSTDELSVLTVLRARELNANLTIVASCRQEQNVQLLKGSGADEVIVSASSAGRILGMAADAPDAARVVNDLLTFGDGLDIDDRIVEKDGDDLARAGQTPIAIVRREGKNEEGRVYRPGHDEGSLPLCKGDRVVFINTREDSIRKRHTEPPAHREVPEAELFE
jgi:voltage-gated potassium channel